MSRTSNVPNVSGLPLFEGQAFFLTGAKDAETEGTRQHRASLNNRFAKSGGDALSDHDVLELLLFRTLPKCHVGPVAERLLETFGDLGGVFSAERHRLEAIKGVGPAVALELSLIAVAAQRMAKSKVVNRPVLSDWAALLAYCRTSMAHRNVEQVRILYLNTKNALIADEVQSEGTVDHAPIYPREVMKRALFHSATALILVHNHPSGDPTPSQGDLAMTRAIQDAAETMNIILHDHIIVGKEKDVSFRSEGLL